MYPYTGSEYKYKVMVNNKSGRSHSESQIGGCTYRGVSRANDEFGEVSFGVDDIDLCFSLFPYINAIKGKTPMEMTHHECVSSIIMVCLLHLGFAFDCIDIWEK